MVQRRAERDKQMQEKCLCTWNPRVGLQTVLGAWGRLSTALPVFGEGLSALPIRSFYLLFRIITVTPPGAVLQAGFN